MRLQVGERPEHCLQKVDEQMVEVGQDVHLPENVTKSGREAAWHLKTGKK
jgi:hypothetical protein